MFSRMSSLHLKWVSKSKIFPTFQCPLISPLCSFGECWIGRDQQPWTQAWVSPCFWGGGNSIQKSNSYPQHKRLWCFSVGQLWNRGSTSPPPHWNSPGTSYQPDITYFSQYTSHFFEIPSVCRRLFLWVTPHIYRYPQAEKLRVQDEGPGKSRRKLLTQSPLSIWYFSEVTWSKAT